MTPSSGATATAGRDTRKAPATPKRATPPPRDDTPPRKRAGLVELLRSEPASSRMMGVIGALVAGLVVFPGIGQPAFWLDEAATVTATRRTWANLWMLAQGADAPLVPYYALMKLVGRESEFSYRWPSALAVTLAVGLLTAWLTRKAGLLTAVAGSGVLLALDGVTRYAQEARPYGIVLLLTVASTVVHERVTRDRLRWTALYAGLLAALVVMNTLAAAIVVAHLIAAVTTGPAAHRRDALLQTTLAALAGLLVAVPQAVSAMSDGTGAGSFPTLTAAHLGRTFLRLFDTSGHLTLGAVVVLLLAGLGIAQTITGDDESFREVAAIAAAWALAPAGVLLVAVVARPNLQISRYLLFTVPGWAVLAGLGLVAIGRMAAVSLGAQWFATFTAVVLGLSVLATAQIPSLLSLRTEHGHGDDVRPVLSSSVPVFAASRLSSIEIAAYAPSRRLLNIDSVSDQTSIWPLARPGYDVRTTLRATRELDVVVHNSVDVGCLEAALGPALRALCLPLSVARRQYRPVGPTVYGAGWAALRVVRPVPCRY